MSIRSKILAGFSVLIFIWLLFGVNIYFRIQTLAGNVRDLDTLFDETVQYNVVKLDGAVNLKSNVNDYQDAVKGYLSGKTGSKQDVVNAAQVLDENYTALKTNLTRLKDPLAGSSESASTIAADQATLDGLDSEHSRLQTDVDQGVNLVATGQAAAAAQLYDGKLKDEFKAFHDGIVQLQRTSESSTTASLNRYEVLTRNVQAGMGVLEDETGGALLAALVLALLSSYVIAVLISRPIKTIGLAARAVENGEYKVELLANLTRSRDELGELARVFQRMAEQVAARVRDLKSQIETLHIEIDEHKRAQEVAGITETDEFRDLAAKAAALRRQREAGGEK